MKRKKLLKALSELLDGKAREQRRHRTELEALLSKLQKKLVELQEELTTEKNDQKKKRLRKALQVVKAQHDKGAQALQGLEAS